MKSRGICIQHDSKTIAKSFVIHIVTLLTEFKVFYISGEDFTKQSAKRLNKELPRKALLFVDQPHIFEGNVRRDIKLIFTRTSSSDSSLRVIDVPEMDCHCGRLFSNECLKINNLTNNDKVLSIHNEILKENKQSQFLLSFTRFVSATIDPETYVHQTISSMNIKDVNCLRILAILGEIEFSSEFVIDKETLSCFDNLQKNCPFIYSKKEDSVKVIRYWYPTVAKYIRNLPTKLQNGLSNIQLFCNEWENYEIRTTFWMDEKFGKPSIEILRLAETVRSKECAKSLINIMHDMELEVEETTCLLHLQLSKIHVSLVLFESLRKIDSHYSVTLARKCLKYCDSIKPPYYNTMKSTILFRIRTTIYNSYQVYYSVYET